jgi:general secretion pathway protein D
VPSFGQRTVTTRLRLRDGESNLLAGLLREDERKSLTGFPGAVRVPILKQLFSNNDSSISQTDIVMLLTPHIIRTSEITEADLKPIYIGSQGNLGIGGPAPLIAPTPDADVPPAGQAPAPAPGQTPPPGVPSPTGGGVIVAPPGTSPVPGTIFVPDPPAPAPAPPPPDAAAAAAPPDTSSSPGIGTAQVFLTPPGTAFRVGGGPYTVPISIANATRLSNMTLTVTFDPQLLRVQAVNEGSFMRSGGASAVFTQQAAPGRVDLTITRAADAVGATGAGLLGAILFEPVAPGEATLTVSGAATGPGGTAMGLQFRPVTIVIQP